MTQLSSKTTIPLGWFIAGYATILSLGVYAGVQLTEIKWMMKNMWTVQDMDRWESEVSALNPTVKLPDAYQIQKRRL